MSNLVHNERIKSLAQFLNNLGLACLIAGRLPYLSTTPMGQVSSKDIVAFATGAFVCVVCVRNARHRLGELRE
jgi:hypothetical protein